MTLRSLLSIRLLSSGLTLYALEPGPGLATEASRAGLRALGISVGFHEPGPLNAIMKKYGRM